MLKFSRRDFIKSSATVTALGSALSIIGCGRKTEEFTGEVTHGPKLNWKLVTAWPPNFPVFGDLLFEFTAWVKEMSGGNFNIHLYSGGELIPPFESFEAVSTGVAEMGHAAAYYWAGKVPSAQFFCSVPFGMNAQQTNAWLYYGGGLELWEEVYAKHNLVPFPAGNTGGQMGGWFKKEINSMEDFKGLKMRIPGIGGQVVSEAGGTTILSPGAEIYTNLERGVIDATEWIGPNHDYLLGLPQIAKYYYYPGWQEPSACCDLFVNKNYFDALPDNYKSIIRTGAMAMNIGMLSKFEEKNSEYLYKIRREFPDVQIKIFPDEVLEELQILTRKVIGGITSKDAQSDKVYSSYMEYQVKIHEWSSLIETNWIV